MCAAECKATTKTLRLLMEAGADVHKTGELGWNALLHASANGTVAAVRMLLAAGAQQDQRNNAGFLAIHLAAQYNLADVAGLWLEMGLDVNIRADNGDTPLICAAITVTQNVKLLIDRGANINFQDNNKGTALFWSCKKNIPDCTQLLLQHGALVNVKCDKGDTAIHMACGTGNRSLVKMLLDNKGDPNLRNDKGQSPLHVACHENRLIIVKLLLQWKVDTDVTDNQGDTPLHLACDGKANDLITLLLTKCDPNIPNKAGFTPFTTACKGGHAMMVKLLLQNDDIDHEFLDTEGNSPIHLACKSGSTDTVQILISSGFKPIAQNLAKETPLIGAAKASHVPMVRLIVEHMMNIFPKAKEFPNTSLATLERYWLVASGFKIRSDISAIEIIEDWVDEELNKVILKFKHNFKMLFKMVDNVNTFDNKF
jgi:ankyrin repeat protein